MKRGQITLFIIIGILVLLAVSLTLYVNKEYIKSIFEERITRLENIPQEIQPLENHIKSCIEDTAKLSLNLVFAQGGYFEPKNHIRMEAFDVAYWFDEKDISPSIQTIEKEIAKSIRYLITGCIMDFEEDYKINIKIIKPIVKISGDKIISSAEVRLIVEYKNLTYNLNKNYEASFESEAKNIYDSAKIIIQSEKEDPGSMDLTLLSNLPQIVNFFKFNETIVYVVSDKEPYLMFANRF